jgi:hypothetical protein
MAKDDTRRICQSVSMTCQDLDDLRAIADQVEVRSAGELVRRLLHVLRELAPAMARGERVYLGASRETARDVSYLFPRARPRR